MAESFEFTELDESIHIGIAILQRIAIGIAILL